MTDFLVEHSIYVVLVVALIVLGGALLYLVGIDRRLTRLEKSEDQQ